MAFSFHHVVENVNEINELQVPIDHDRILDFKEFLDKVKTCATVNKHNLFVQFSEEKVKLFMIEKIQISMCIVVDKNMIVHAKRYNTIISLRDLLGFQWHMSRWSQLEAIVTRTKISEISIHQEVNAMIDQLINKCQDNAISIDSTLQFKLDQLKIHYTHEKGRRHSASTIIEALRIFLSSRKCYNLLRTNLTLPHPDTIKRHIGPISLTGSQTECASLVKDHFQCLNSSQLHITYILNSCG